MKEVFKARHPTPSTSAAELCRVFVVVIFPSHPLERGARERTRSRTDGGDHVRHTHIEFKPN